MASIKPSFLYGVRSGVKGGIHFSGEQSILYPAGSGVARYSCDMMSVIYSAVNY